MTGYSRVDFNTAIVSQCFKMTNVIAYRNVTMPGEIQDIGSVLNRALSRDEMWHSQEREVVYSVQWRT